MQRNKYFIVLLIAVFLILGFWGVKTFAPKSGEKDPVKPVASELIPVEEVRISPANILSVIQLGEVFTVKGTGVANSNLSLLQKGKTKSLATTTINAEGEWELSFEPQASDNELILNLLMLTASGQQIQSDQSLVFVKYRSFNEENLDAPQKALILLSAPGSNSRVLQTPFASLPGQKGFVLEAVDYDNSGGVIFSGLSVQMGKVRVYANGNFVGESRVNNSGRWNLIFGNVMPMGRYNIAAELVYNVKAETSDSEGTEESETKEEETILLNLPFSRMQPLLDEADSPDIVVEYLENSIQVGRALYGGGYQFTAIYSPQALIGLTDE